LYYKNAGYDYGAGEVSYRLCYFSSAVTMKVRNKSFIFNYYSLASLMLNHDVHWDEGEESGKCYVTNFRISLQNTL
jgi:hypothetical protein